MQCSVGRLPVLIEACVPEIDEKPPRAINTVVRRAKKYQMPRSHSSHAALLSRQFEACLPEIDATLQRAILSCTAPTNAEECNEAKLASFTLILNFP